MQFTPIALIRRVLASLGRWAKRLLIYVGHVVWLTLASLVAACLERATEHRYENLFVDLAAALASYF